MQSKLFLTMVSLLKTPMIILLTQKRVNEDHWTKSHGDHIYTLSPHIIFY